MNRNTITRYEMGSSKGLAVPKYVALAIDALLAEQRKHADD